MSDLIKRSDAIATIGVMYERCDTYDITDYRDLMLEAVKVLPSADRPQGEWIRDRYWSRGVGMGEEYGFFYKCSMCEYEVESGYTRCGFNYCPYCGAKMKGATDGNQ